MSKKTTPEATEKTTTVLPDPDQWVIDNYEAIVADDNRTTTFDDIAKQAAANGDPILAAWARKRANGDDGKAADDSGDDDADPYKGLTVPELKALADGRDDVELEATDLKDDILSKLKAADDAKAQAGDN